MLSGLKDKLQNKKIEIEKLISEVNFSDLKSKSSASLSHVFNSVDSETKQDIRIWIQSIQEIKNNHELSASDKRQKISQVKTSDTFLKFLNSLLDVLVNKIPFENKKLLKTGISGVGIASTFIRFEFSAITLLVVRAALPQFILSDKFDEFLSFLESQLNEPAKLQ